MNGPMRYIEKTQEWKSDDLQLFSLLTSYKMDEILKLMWIDSASTLLFVTILTK